MLNLLFSNEKYQSTKLNAGLLFLRITAGLTMAFAHGFGKIPVQDQFVQGVASMGLPFPELFAWAAALAEFLGGIFLALGLATRLSALSWIATMAGAAFIIHGADPFNVQELSLLYLFFGIFFFITGAGKFSIDGAINRK